MYIALERGIRQKGSRVSTIERNLTEMLRSSGDVLREAEHHDVVLRRRDGADMMLVELDRERAIRRSLGDAARIIVMMSDAPSEEQVIDLLPRALPWAEFLSRADRQAFLHDFVRTAAACIDADVFEPLAQLDREWRATAAVHADPALRAELAASADDEDDLGPVPRP